MQYFFGGLALLLLLIFAGRSFVKADPKKLAQTLRKIGGWAMLAAAGLLALRGLLPIALPLALVGAMLLGRGFPLTGFPGGFGPSPGRANKSRGQRSTVRTAHLEMTLDHDSGEIDGVVIKGQHGGRRLGSLGVGELVELHAAYNRKDPRSAQLLAAYLDRLHEGWREAAGGDAGGADGGGRAASGAMTADEALDVLGLEPGAGPEQITRAHRKLMKKLHPDQGGSTYFAAKVNQARDLLMARAKAKSRGINRRASPRS